MLQRVSVLLIVLLLLPDFYLYFRFRVHRLKSLILRALYWLPSAVLIGGMLFLVFFAGSHAADIPPQVIGWFSILFFLIAAPKLVLALFTLTGSLFGRWTHHLRKAFVIAGMLAGIVCAGVILYGAFVGRSRFEVKEVSFASTRLPASFDGYRILQFSDLHIGSWQGNKEVVERLVERINAQHADLIVFTGDLVNHRATELDGFESILSRLKAKDGVFSILGNHDYAPYLHWKSPEAQQKNLEDLLQRQKAMGWIMLNNSHAILRQGTDSLALIGVENDGEPPFSQYARLQEAIRGTESLFKVLLSHNPTHWRREVLPETDIDLMLAGHTHGMQLRIGRYSPSSHIYPEWGGMYGEGERGLYVNVGVGYVGLPFRFGAWPEITVITLRKKK